MNDSLPRIFLEISLNESLINAHVKTYYNPQLCSSHFTPKTNLITFLYEWGKIPPEVRRSAHHTRNRRCQDDLNTSLAWWNYNKHNPFTQNTSLKEHIALAIYHNAVRHATSSAVFLKRNLLLVSCPNVSVNIWACTVWLSVIVLTCLLSLLWLSFYAEAMLKIRDKVPQLYLKRTASVKKKLNSLKLHFKNCHTQKNWAIEKFK